MKGYKFKNVNISNKNSEHVKFLQTLGNLFFVFCMIIATCFILFSFMLVECVVVGESMQPTFNSNAKSGNDIVYVNRFDRDFGFGDVIVVNFDNKDSIIKRVVGVSGDQIDIVFLEDMGYFLEVNGTLIMEDYLNLKYDVKYEYLQNGMNHTYDHFQLLKESHPELFNSDEKLIVPEGEVFALGDNRHDSKDSTSYGTFKESQLMGKVELVRNSNDNEFNFYYNYIASGKVFNTIGNCF